MGWGVCVHMLIYVRVYWLPLAVLFGTFLLLLVVECHVPLHVFVYLWLCPSVFSMCWVISAHSLPDLGIVLFSYHSNIHSYSSHWELLL